VSVQRQSNEPTAAQVLELVARLSYAEQAKVRNVLLEDQEDIKTALERLSSPGRIWSLEELEKEFGLAG
jgi:hypothetical protein